MEPRQVSSLSRLSKATRIPQAVLIREGIDAVLEKRKHEIPPEEPRPPPDHDPGDAMTDWQATLGRGFFGCASIIAVIVTQGHEPAWSIALAVLGFVMGWMVVRRR